MKMAWSKFGWLILALSLSVPAVAQQPQTLPDGPKPQGVPETPSSSVPIPRNLPAAPPPSSAPSDNPSEDTTFPGDRPAAQQQQPKPDLTEQQPGPKPVVRTVPPGGQTKTPQAGQDELKGTISRTVNLVIVPVSIKDDSGRPVYGLEKANFKILENGVQQPIRFFSSDPLGISAAILIDVGMPDIALKKVQETFQAIVGAFSEYDEVAIYTFSDNIKQQQDFNAALGDRTATTFKRVKFQSGRPGGAATTEGPMVAGPSVNGDVFNRGDPSRPQTTSVRNIDPPHTLNDAILRAAIDLSHRPRERRKVIFVISDGREDRSTASYSDVLKVLLSNEVQVYAVGVDSAAMPGYAKLSKIRLPRQPYGNILPKYANATGGELLTALNKDTMEQAYSKLMDDARNQYTIGYTSPATLSTAYRSIEVRVSADTSVKVFARDGYYPLPPSRK